jgi:hypothetical protein
MKSWLEYPRKDIKSVVEMTHTRPRVLLEGGISPFRSEGIKAARSRARRADVDATMHSEVREVDKGLWPCQLAETPGMLYSLWKRRDLRAGLMLDCNTSRLAERKQQFNRLDLSRPLARFMGPPLLKLDVLTTSTSSTSRNNRRIHLPPAFLKLCKLAAGDFVVVKPSLEPEDLSALTLNGRNDASPKKRASNFLLAQAWPCLNGEDDSQSHLVTAVAV